MGQSRKISTPAYKRCSHCKVWKPKDEFPKNRCRQDGLNNWCKICKKAYRQSPQGKESEKRSRRKYSQTPEGKEANRRRNQTPRRIMCLFRKDAKYRLTDKCRLRRERFYARHGGQATYNMAYYYRIQDEAGCHMGIDDFYSGYRIIKALETAPVVEIKV